MYMHQALPSRAILVIQRRGRVSGSTARRCRNGGEPLSAPPVFPPAAQVRGWARSRRGSRPASRCVLWMQAIGFLERDLATPIVSELPTE